MAKRPELDLARLPFRDPLIHLGPHSASARQHNDPMVNRTRSQFAGRAGVTVSRRMLLNEKHAAEIPSRMVGGKAFVHGRPVRQSDIDKRRDMRLPGSKLTLDR
jgi:hypothetical protein